MSRNTSVSIGQHFTHFIDSQIKGGRYGSASDVIRAGLRLLEEHETRVKALPGETWGQADARLRREVEKARANPSEVQEKEATETPAKLFLPG